MELPVSPLISRELSGCFADDPAELSAGLPVLLTVANERGLPTRVLLWLLSPYQCGLPRPYPVLAA